MDTLFRQCKEMFWANNTLLISEQVGHNITALLGSWLSSVASVSTKVVDGCPSPALVSCQAIVLMLLPDAPPFVVVYVIHNWRALQTLL